MLYIQAAPQLSSCISSASSHAVKKSGKLSSPLWFSHQHDAHLPVFPLQQSHKLLLLTVMSSSMSRKGCRCIIVVSYAMHISIVYYTTLMHWQPARQRSSKYKDWTPAYQKHSPSPQLTTSVTHTLTHLKSLTKHNNF